MVSIRVLWLTCMVVLLVQPARADSLRGALGVDGYIFAQQPRQFNGQSSSPTISSAYMDLHLSGQTPNEIDYELEMFNRLSPSAERFWSVDLRQATLSMHEGDVEGTLGVLSSSWGVLEAWSPVDIINQRDYAEDFQGQSKLGQPGAVSTLRLDDTVLSFYALTYARGQRVAEGRDRLRSLAAEVIHERFEQGRWSPSLAARAGFKPEKSLDVTISHYRGHAREPCLQPVISDSGLRGFRATYAQIQQSSIETQYVLGNSVLKSEIFYQQGAGDSFWGSGTGVETTFNRFANGLGDLIVFGEFYYDARTAHAPLTPFQRDLFLGLRYSYNDVHDTVAQMRLTHDLEWNSQVLEFRVSRRQFDRVLISAALFSPFNTSRDMALSGYGDDAYLKLGFAWHY